MFKLKRKILAAIVCAAMLLCACSESSSSSSVKDSESAAANSQTQTSSNTDSSSSSDDSSSVDNKIQDTSNVAMWECTDKSGGKLTMLGSIHLGKSNIYPLSDKITKPFEASDLLVIETDPNSPDALSQANESIMQYSDNTLLKDKLSAQAYKIFTDKLAEMDTPEKLFEKYKPWGAYEAIEAFWILTSGLNPNYGVDNNFIQSAKESKKEIYELETAKQQLDIYTQAPDITFDALFKLLKTETRDTYCKQLNDLYNAWLKGDTDTIQGLDSGTTKEEYKKAGLNEKEIQAVENFNKAIKQDRNVKMAEKLEKLLKDGKKAYVVIGAAHFLGDGSILSLLEKKGYTIKRI